MTYTFFFLFLDKFDDYFSKFASSRSRFIFDLFISCIMFLLSNSGLKDSIAFLGFMVPIFKLFLLNLSTRKLEFSMLEYAEMSMP